MTKNKIFELIDEIGKINGVSEIIINGLDNVFVEKNGELIKLEARLSKVDLDGFCQDLASFNKKAFNSDYPILDGNLADGSRVNLIHEDYTKETHAVTIRRYSKSIKTFDNNPTLFGLNPHWIDFLKVLIKSKMNVVVSGGTGVGKTTFLNLLLQEIPTKERVITIEDTRELQFNLPNVVRLEARLPFAQNKGLTMRDLLKNTLRMRPDRIILGECRGGEVFDLLQAMNTGHEGSLTSVHANSPGECLLRLENLYSLSGHDLPIKALRYQISSAVDFIIQLKRDKDGKRLVSQITEISNMEGDRILSQDIGLNKSGELKFTGLVPSCFEKLQKAGLPKDFFIGT
jgi:pilus assembly protein CpaF